MKKIQMIQIIQTLKTIQIIILKNEIYYSIVCDNKYIGNHKVKISSTLEEIRRKLNSLFPENGFF